MTRRQSASRLQRRPLLAPLIIALLVIGATLRLTRFVTTDWLGEWTIDKPARRWANTHEALVGPDERRAFQNGTTDIGDFEVDPKNGWRSKLVKGLSCPFCVGFWIGFVLIVMTTVIPRPLHKVWISLLAALGMNYVVGHISSRID